MPFKKKSRGCHKMVLVPDPEKEQVKRINKALIEGLAKAHLWQRQMDQGKTVTDIAHKNKLSRTYVQRVVRMNFLAPKLKRMILRGEVSEHLKLGDFINDTPVLWRDQEDLIRV